MSLSRTSPLEPLQAPSIDWDHLIRRFSPVLHRFLTGRARRLAVSFDPDIATETLQDLWCRVFEKGGEPLREALARGEGATRAYLVLVGGRILVDRVRALRAAKRGRGMMAAEVGTVVGNPLRCGDPYNNPELGFLLREGRRAFGRDCDRIARRSYRCGLRQRNARILRRALLEGWSSLEIVDGERELGVRIAASSVDTMISRARSSLARAGWQLPDRGRRRLSRI